MKIETNETSYIINDKRYTRVTYLAELMDSTWKGEWTDRVGMVEAERMMREAAEFGNNVHKICSYVDWIHIVEIEKMYNENEWLKPYCREWREWKENNVDQVICVEKLFWSDELGVAGTIDRVYLLYNDEQPVIVDIKTGSLHDSIGIQLELYKRLYNEKHYFKVDRCLVAHMPRKDFKKLRIVDRYNDPKFVEMTDEVLRIHGGNR